MTQPAYIGLMSGTSMDAIDGVLVAFDDQSRRVTVFAAESLDIPTHQRRTLEQLVRSGQGSLIQLMTLDRAIAEFFIEVSQRLVQTQVSGVDIRGLGLSGQTVAHLPGARGRPSHTLQLGDPHVVAASLSPIPVVAEFRRSNTAWGGQGAPLTPAFHAWFWEKEGPSCCVLNLGGIANITWLPDEGAMLRGSDIGPANTLMDAWYQEHHQGWFDEDGCWAAAGKVQAELLLSMQRHPFFREPYPKSADRETFSLSWLREILAQCPAYRPEDVQATLMALTIDCIRQAVGSRTTLVVCGGGAYNLAMLAALQKALPYCKIQSTQAWGLDPKHIEACAFAFMARERLEGRALSLKAVTGAYQDRPLGVVFGS